MYICIHTQVAAPDCVSKKGRGRGGGGFATADDALVATHVRCVFRSRWYARHQIPVNERRSLSRLHAVNN